MIFFSNNNKGDNEKVLCRDLVSFSLELRKTRKTSIKRPPDEGCATSHRLKWGPLYLNDVIGITQHIRKGEGRKEGNVGVGCMECIKRICTIDRGCDTTKSFSSKALLTYQCNTIKSIISENSTVI